MGNFICYRQMNEIDAEVLCSSLERGDDASSQNSQKNGILEESQGSWDLLVILSYVVMPFVGLILVPISSPEAGE